MLHKHANANNSNYPGQHMDGKDAEPTPRGSNDPWHFGSSGLTPSTLDPNSHNFSMFANHMPGYYTPGGTNTLYHNQAGDLHTPGFSSMGGGLGTPLSMPTSDGAMNVSQQATNFHGFSAHMPPHMQSQFQNVNPFNMHHGQAFPPQNFTHQPFEHMDPNGDDSPMGDVSLDMDIQHHNPSPDMLFHSQSMHAAMNPPHLHQSSEK